MNINLDTVIDKLLSPDQGKLSVFCGAGISRDSGLPLVDEIIREVVYVLRGNSRFADSFLNKYKSKKIPFESFMQDVISLSGDDELLNVFNNGLPNANHYFVAYLCNYGFVFDVYTTNFDCLLERAMDDIGLIKDKDYCVFFDEKSLKKSIDMRDGGDSRVFLYKIHGDIGDKDSLRVTMSSINERKLLKSRVEVIDKAFFNGNDIGNILVLGYSFSDVFDINLAIKRSKNKCKKFMIYINHTDDVGVQLINRIDDGFLKDKIGTAFYGYDYFVNTFIFVRSFIEKFGVGLKYIKNVCNWEKSVVVWADKMSKEKKYYIISELLFCFGLFKQALNYNKLVLNDVDISSYFGLDLLYQKVKILHRIGGKENVDESKQFAEIGLNCSDSIGYKFGAANFLSHLALVSLYNKDDHVASYEKYKKALCIYEEINDDRGAQKTILSIASCLRVQGDYFDARKMYRRSLCYRIKSGDILGAGKCYQGIANVYLQEKKYPQAYKYYSLFFEMAQQLDEQWSMSAALYGMADVLISYKKSKKVMKKAKDMIDQSLSYRCENKKNREYANVLFLKAKILFLLGDLLPAKRLHYKAYAIRQKLGKETDIADSLYYIGFVEMDLGRYLNGVLKVCEAAKIYKSWNCFDQLNEVVDNLNKKIIPLDSKKKRKIEEVIFSAGLKLGGQGSS